MIKLTTEILKQVIQVRPNNSYKGTFGKCLLIAGSAQYGGAALLASSAAVYSGAGLVTLATDPINFTSSKTRLPEVMNLDLKQSKLILELAKQVQVVAFGPGLLINEVNSRLLEKIIEQMKPEQTLILDASGFGIIKTFQVNLKLLQAQLILTPHVGEWQHVSELAVSQQTSKNNQRQLDLLTPAGAALVLKGAPSHIYFSQTETIFENTLGTPAMATGGMGDALTGILAGFVAQFGWQPEVVLAAVFAHSYLAQELAQKQYVVLPSQLVQALPIFMKQWE
ncbi:NAD(P)H-hydrate dehydratase [Bombilactobacillus folatiphilus]|uniref:ADP-dependent (S)-NAD(P)H-hydrate dehydratase n=1 Tax=Bombilactobacillus folatiphilus TaxID=2923362 RepID=A0ABY4PAF9_9LACO|nr:NAD(P)H-hydrate dehydratase [Bombilactobacillus folatiphilus]UQS82619.1 NAD(P)H-hydrate dehydratase [Bombilactobacillus folatiphilus]